MIDEVGVVENQSGESGSPFSDPPRPLFAHDAGATAPAGIDGPSQDAYLGELLLDGRLAVVTGAAGLLGASIASELARRGARVCLIGRSAPELRRTIATMSEGSRAAMLRCDLASADEVRSAADFVERIDSPVDLLIHAAGLHVDATIAEGTLESLDEHYLLNVRGPYLLTQRLLGLLGDARGQVVFFTSSPGATPTGRRAGGDVHHTISQAGLQAFAGELRVEASARGVRVLSVETDDAALVDAVGEGSLDALARTVTDALCAPDVDVTDLKVRMTPHTSPTARR